MLVSHVRPGTGGGGPRLRFAPPPPPPPPPPPVEVEDIDVDEYVVFKRTAGEGGLCLGPPALLIPLLTILLELLLIPSYI